jgi:predicted ester cyclase
MISENEAILHRWIDEVWNNGKLETIDELFDEQGAAMSPINEPENPVRGIDAFKKFFHQTGELFTDIFMTVEESFDDGEKVVALCTFTANRINKDADGNIIKKPVKVSGLCQIKIAKGKIYEAWNNLDLANAGLLTLIFSQSAMNFL